jgi:hypothetical protein
MQEEKKSVAAMGFELLEKNISETDFGSEIALKELFDLLADDDLDCALELFGKKS